jgi:hypothetical protein
VRERPIVETAAFRALNFSNQATCSSSNQKHLMTMEIAILAKLLPFSDASSSCSL